MKAIAVFSTLAFLATFTSGVEIECIFIDFEWFDYTPLYTCRGIVISMENPTLVTKMSGNHEAGREDSDVKGFRIIGDQINLTTISNGIGNFFASLQVFSWTYGNISSIDSRTFRHFPNLLYIDLTQNRIVALDGDLFQFTRKLRWIHFDSNSLQHVGHDLLTGLRLKGCKFPFESVHQCKSHYSTTNSKI